MTKELSSHVPVVSESLPPSIRRLRQRQSSAFAVYGAFVVAEFNNLLHTTQPSSQRDRGELLADRIRGQLGAVESGSSLVWRSPPDNYESVFELDRLNLRLMSYAQLELRAFALLERYRTLFADAELERITRVMQDVDGANAANPERLIAQADEMLASMHWYFLFSRARDRRVYELMKFSTAALAAIASSILACVAAKLLGEPGSKVGELASFAVFLLMGGLGAATSFVWRLQMLLNLPPSLPETHLTDLGGLKYGGQGLLVSVGCGVVFAFVLYMLFAGSVLTGSLFPTIETPKTTEGGLPLSMFFSKSGPAAGSDYAKLLFWLFLSGFAEKFVPDVLDRIRKSSQAIREGK